MELSQLLVAAAALALAGLVHGTLGIGFPLVSTPLLAAAMDVRTAVLITLLPTIAVNLVSIVHGGAWRAVVMRYWPLAGWCVAGALLGAWLLTVLDPAPFKLVLAGTILLYLNAERFRFMHMTWVRQRPQLGMAAFGLAAGLSAGSVNVMVPILVIYALQRQVPRAVTVSMFNLCFVSGKLSQMAVFGQAGLLSGELLWWTAAGAALALMALFVGFRLRASISEATYRVLLRRLLALMALVLVAEFIWEI